MPNFMNPGSLDIGQTWFSKHTTNRFEIVAITQEGVTLQEEEGEDLSDISTSALATHYYQLDNESCRISNVMRTLKEEHKNLLSDNEDPEVVILKTFNRKITKSILDIKDEIFEQYSGHNRSEISQIMTSAIKDYLEELINDEARKLKKSRSLQL